VEYLTAWVATCPLPLQQARGLSACGLVASVSAARQAESSNAHAVVTLDMPGAALARVGLLLRGRYVAYQPLLAVGCRLRFPRVREVEGSGGLQELAAPMLECLAAPEGLAEDDDAPYGLFEGEEGAEPQLRWRGAGQRLGPEHPHGATLCFEGSIRGALYLPCVCCCVTNRALSPSPGPL
jgi:hypothetical protein